MSNQLFNEVGVLIPFRGSVQGANVMTHVTNKGAARVAGEIVRLDHGGVPPGADLQKDPFAYTLCNTVFPPIAGSNGYRGFTIYGVCMEDAAVDDGVTLMLKGTFMSYCQWVVTALNSSNNSILVTGLGIANASNPTGGNYGVLSSPQDLALNASAKIIGIFLGSTGINAVAGNAAGDASLNPVLFDGIGGFGTVSDPL